jgi:hypothetical protein
VLLGVSDGFDTVKNAAAAAIGEGAHISEEVLPISIVTARQLCLVLNQMRLGNAVVDQRLEISFRQRSNDLSSKPHAPVVM